MSAGYLAKCGQKKRHLTQVEAETQRAAMIAKGVWQAGSSNTYWCSQCGSYHAGRMRAGNRGKGRQMAKNARRHLDSQ